jgi:hypothetical protein
MTENIANMTIGILTANCSHVFDYLYNLAALLKILG